LISDILVMHVKLIRSLTKAFCVMVAFKLNPSLKVIFQCDFPHGRLTVMSWTVFFSCENTSSPNQETK